MISLSIQFKKTKASTFSANSGNIVGAASSREFIEILSSIQHPETGE